MKVVTGGLALLLVACIPETRVVELDRQSAPSGLVFRIVSEVGLGFAGDSFTSVEIVGHKHRESVFVVKTARSIRAAWNSDGSLTVRYALFVDNRNGADISLIRKMEPGWQQTRIRYFRESGE